MELQGIDDARDSCAWGGEGGERRHSEGLTWPTCSETKSTDWDEGAICSALRFFLVFRMELFVWSFAHCADPAIGSGRTHTPYHRFVLVRLLLLLLLLLAACKAPLPAHNSLLASQTGSLFCAFFEVQDVGELEKLAPRTRPAQPPSAAPAT